MTQQNKKTQTLLITKRILQIGFIFLFIQFITIVIQLRNDETRSHKFEEFKRFMSDSAKLRPLFEKYVFYSSIMKETENETKCHPKFANKPMHIGGSGGSSEFIQSFDYLSPPGSNNRVSPRKLSYQYEKPIVTIITAANNPIYIDETANCIFAQSLQLFEWIIVNDHSNTEAVIGKYRNHSDSRVKVIDCDPHTKTPCGLPRTRNIGLGYSQTEYIVFLDDDDLLDSTYLEKLVWFLESNVEFSYVNSYSVAFEAKTYLWSHTFYESSLKENQQAVTSMIRTNALKAIAGDKWPHALEEDRIGGMEDWVMWLTLKNAGYHGATIPEYMFWYRMKKKRRKWDFLEKDESSKATGTKQLRVVDGSKSQAKVEPFSAKVGQQKFPDLYERGHVNPVISETITKYDSFKDASFLNMQITEETLHPGCDIERRMILVIPWLALGGADMVNVKLIRLLSEKNWKVTVVNTLSTSSTSSTSSSLDFFRPIVQQYTEDIFTLPHFLRVKDYARFILYLIRSRSARVLMTSNSFAAYNLLPYLKIHSPDVVFADFVHMRQLDWKMAAYFQNQEEAESGGYPRLSAIFSQYLDLSLFVSDDERRWVAGAMGLSHPNENQKVIYYGIDSDKFKLDLDMRREARKTFGISNDTLCVIFSGRFVDQKRPDVLLRVFHKLTTELKSMSSKKAHLLIIGDGELRPEMEDYIKNNDMGDKVSMLGKVNQEKMLPILSAGDVLFLPSKMEGLSVALVEAMGMGLVPVVTNVGGHREIVRNGTGCLLERDDEEGMLKCLISLALEPDTLKLMSNNSKSIVEREFSYPVMKRSVHENLVSAINKLKTVELNEEVAAKMLQVENDLPKALQHIYTITPVSATLVGALAALSIPKRGTAFGRELTRFCYEDASTMSSWITMMEKATMCDSSYPSSKPSALAVNEIGQHILLQCGQWCVFNTQNPDGYGWVFNGECFSKFESKNHFCHSYTELKDKLKK